MKKVGRKTLPRIVFLFWVRVIIAGRGVCRHGWPPRHVHPIDARFFLSFFQTTTRKFCNFYWFLFFLYFNFLCFFWHKCRWFTVRKRCFLHKLHQDCSLIIEAINLLEAERRGLISKLNTAIEDSTAKTHITIGSTPQFVLADHKLPTFDPFPMPFFAMSRVVDQNIVDQESFWMIQSDRKQYWIMFIPICKNKKRIASLWISDTSCL